MLFLGAKLLQKSEMTKENPIFLFIFEKQRMLQKGKCKSFVFRQPSEWYRDAFGMRSGQM